MAMVGSFFAQLAHQRGYRSRPPPPVGGRDGHHPAHRLRERPLAASRSACGSAHGARMFQQVQPGGRERHFASPPEIASRPCAVLWPPRGGSASAGSDPSLRAAAADSEPVSAVSRNAFSWFDRGYPCADVYVHCNLPQFLSRLRMDSAHLCTALNEPPFCPYRFPPSPLRRSVAPADARGQASPVSRTPFGVPCALFLLSRSAAALPPPAFPPSPRQPVCVSSTAVVVWSPAVAWRTRRTFQARGLPRAKASPGSSSLGLFLHRSHFAESRNCPRHVESAASETGLRDTLVARSSRAQAGRQTKARPRRLLKAEPSRTRHQRYKPPNEKRALILSALAQRWPGHHQGCGTLPQT